MMNTIDPDTAGAKVFAVAELLENILLHLGTRELFGILRVSKAFRDTAHGSQSLQRAMFLAGGEPEEGVVKGPMPNTLLNEMRLPIFPTVHCDFQDTTQDKSTKLFVRHWGV